MKHIKHKQKRERARRGGGEERKREKKKKKQFSKTKQHIEKNMRLMKKKNIKQCCTRRRINK